MKREEKAQIIEELSQKMAANPNFTFVNGAGLTVVQENNFRKLCYSKGIEYKVVKNTFIKKALERNNVDSSALEGTVLAGSSGILIAEAANAPAKLLKEFYKSAGLDKPVFKGASVEFDFYVGQDQLEALVNIKSRDELVGDIIGLLQSPAKNVVSALSSGGGKLAGILKTLEERGN
jgi:large subunit ribosomal protein L10